MALVDGTLTIATAGTAQRITTTVTPVRWILLQMLTGAQTVVVGASTVVAAAATRRGIIVPEQQLDAAPASMPLELKGPLDLADLYFDTLVDAGVVKYLYLRM